MKNLFAHTVAVMRLCLLRNKDLVLKITFFELYALSANVIYTSQLLYYPKGMFKGRTNVKATSVSFFSTCEIALFQHSTFVTS